MGDRERIDSLLDHVQLLQSRIEDLEDYCKLIEELLNAKQDWRGDEL
jgi:hypothetical protein